MEDGRKALHVPLLFRRPDDVRNVEDVDLIDPTN